MTNVERRERYSALRLARGLKQFRRSSSILAVVAVCSSTATFLPRAAGASGISHDRATAAILYTQIQRINSQVGYLGQKYDEAHGKLFRLNHEINNTRATVKSIERAVAKGNTQLRLDAVFAYVTNGAAASNNPLFSSHAAKVGATNVYNQLAEGNVSATLASLKNYKIELTQQRSMLRSEDQQAANSMAQAATAFHDSQVLQNSLQHALHQVRGQIAYFITQQEAAAAAQARAAISQAQAQPQTQPSTQPGAPPGTNFPAPPPNSQANIAVNYALSLVGVPYVWGGASRSGVDCSGLVMLAYAAAGIYLPHYSGAQFADTVRVPLSDIQPGDILFYGVNGDEHEAMYLGNGQMIEAPYTGAYVHVTPVRLGYGFAGVGRPRA